MDYHYQPSPIECVQYVAVNHPTAAVFQDMKSEVKKVYRNVAKALKHNKHCRYGHDDPTSSSKSDVEYLKELGYTDDDLRHVPETSLIGLGCGNPQTIASLKPGEYVVDLGCGGGFDVFLASRKVGAGGKVYGIEMTPEVVYTARKSAEKEGYRNVAFLLGEIEHLPLANKSVDVVISNCAVNLSQQKTQVFKEAFRVLKDGGRLAISDIVAYRSLPKAMLEDLYCNCISGALTIDELRRVLYDAGFVDILIESQENSRMFIKDWVPGSDAENYVVLAKIKATKPCVRR